MKQQTVLITGASRGIGREFAKTFAKKGYNLVLIAHDKDKKELTETATQLSAKSIVTISIDLAKENAAQTIFDQLKKDKIQIDILINNAGFGYHAAFLNSDWDRHKNLVNVNVIALMQMNYLFGHEMQKRHYGKILNVASIAADLPGPYMSTYYASKAFVLSFSYALADELKGSGVKISTLCPGPTKTGFERTATMKHSRMFSFLPANPKNVAILGYLMIISGWKLAFYGLFTNIYNLILRILPRFINSKIAKLVNNNPSKK